MKLIGFELCKFVKTAKLRWLTLMKLYTKKHRHIHGISVNIGITWIRVSIYILLLVGVGNDSLVLHEF